MTNLPLLAVCFSLGWLGQRARWLPKTSPQVLSKAVLWVCLPALVLRVVPHVQFDPALVPACAGIWLNCALCAVGAMVAVRFGWADRTVAGAVALTMGLGNTAFIGVPLLTALGGAEATGPAAVVDQLGSFAAFSLISVPFALNSAGSSVKPAVVIGRLVRFPPFIALVMAFALRGVELPGPIDVVLHGLAFMLSPLALLALGLQFHPSAVRGKGQVLAPAILGRLVIAPLVMWALLALTGTTGLVARVAVTQAAMGPMVTAGVLASEHKLAPELAAAIVALGTPLSLVTAPLWWWALGLAS